MKIIKTNNQYYAEYFENQIMLNLKPDYIPKDINYQFSRNEIVTMNNHAKILSDKIRDDFSNIYNIEYTGRHTLSSAADFIINNQLVEIKYVASGSGTYFNTSLSYVNEILGLKSFHSFIPSTYLFLENIYGKSVYKNFSPVNADKAKELSNRENYHLLQKIEAKERANYTKYLVDSLKNNPDKMLKFGTDMLNKRKVTYLKSNKYLTSKDKDKIPQFIYIFNHNKETIQTLTKEDISQKLEFEIIEDSNKTNFSIKFDTFRAAIGWQNRIGNNPTIRIFLT